MSQIVSKSSTPAPDSSEAALDVSVCIPVFNEKLALRDSILEFKEAMEKLPYSYEIIVVDDGSTDGCTKTIEDLDVRILRHRRNIGGGVARMTGMRHARGRIIMQSDADGTYPVDRVPEILDRMKDADMVIGARIRESATNWRFLRIIMKGLLKLLAGRLAGQHIPDLNSGMRCYDREIALRYGYLYPRGHSIMSTMTLAFLADGLKVDFVDIDYNVRKGKSSFRPIQDTYNYLVTIIRTVVYFNPFRVLMPLVLTLGVLATVFSIRNLIQHAGLGDMPILLWVTTLFVFVLAILSDQFARMSKQISYHSEPNLHDPLISEEKAGRRGPT